MAPVLSQEGVCADADGVLSLLPKKTSMFATLKAMDFGIDMEQRRKDAAAEAAEGDADIVTTTLVLNL